ncbi:Protein DBF4 -like protein A [Halotydeus destructor]|nr:Protein DBF4 -like protein A [Halotydeus destructor]
MTTVKRDHNGKKMFTGKVFYLDLRNMPTIKGRLSQGILSLGGKVDEFLGPQVNYVVTDKDEKDWPPRPSKQDRNKLTVNAPDVHEHVSNSSINFHHTYSAPATEAIDLFSRGKLLVAKAGANANSLNHNQATNSNNVQSTPYKANTSDVLEVAVKKGIKLLAAKTMLSFLVRTQEQSVENEDPSQMKSIRAINLSAPFVKVEATDQRTAPFVKGLARWPEINLEAQSGSPFSAPKQACLSSRFTINNQSAPKESQPLLPLKTLDNNVVDAAVVQEKQASDVADRSNDATMVSGGQQPTKTPTKSRAVKRAKGNIPLMSITPKRSRKSLVKKTALTKAKASYWCEVCGVSYDSLSEHVRSEKHDLFAREEENWRELINVLESVPRLADLEPCLDELSCSQSSRSNHQDEESPLVSTPPTPASSSQTITLASLTSRPHGKFISLNEYISKSAINNANAMASSMATPILYANKMCKRIVEEEEPQAGGDIYEEEEEEATSAYDRIITTTPKMPKLSHHKAYRGFTNDSGIGTQEKDKDFSEEL